MNMKQTALLWEIGYSIKMGLALFVVLALVVMLLVPQSAFATDDYRPPKRERGDVSQSNPISVGVSSPTHIRIRDGDVVQKGGSQEANPTINFGGETPLVETTVGGSPISVDAGNSPITLDTGGNVSDNDFFALSVGAPNISGCIVGGSAGGSDGGTGGLFQWGRLNHDCYMNELSAAERHIETRATLKCGSAKVRRAIAYRTPNANTIEKTNTCIKHFERVWKGEIDYLKELVVNTQPPKLIDTEYSAAVGETPPK